VGSLGSSARPILAGLASSALLAVAFGCSSGDDAASSEASGDDAAGETTTTAEADCSPARPFDASGEEQTFEFEGQDRAYVVTLPDDYDGTIAVPLVFGFHGYGGSTEVVARDWGLPELGAERGYAVVTGDALPQNPADPATPLEWNMFSQEGRPDDFAYVLALLTDLEERLCVDDSRVYAAGHSNGSAFTGFLKCEEPYPFAAVAMVSAFIPATCPVDAASPSVLAIHGTADPGVPYDGGTVANSSTQIPAFLDTLHGYAESYRCDDPPREDELAPQVERTSYTGCVGDAEVAGYTVVDGNHEWPGSARAAGPGEDWSATEAILDFFDAHTLP
jgi:polyhydroxybutyrate depolymerase